MAAEAPGKKCHRNDVNKKIKRQLLPYKAKETDRTVTNYSITWPQPYTRGTLAGAGINE